MELELETRHQAELAQLPSESPPASDEHADTSLTGNGEVGGATDPSIGTEQIDLKDGTEEGTGKKSKAQRRKVRLASCSERYVHNCMFSVPVWHHAPQCTQHDQYFALTWDLYPAWLNQATLHRATHTQARRLHILPIPLPTATSLSPRPRGHTS